MHDPLQAALAAALAVAADGQPCTLGFGPVLVNDRSDGRYAWFELQGDCGHPPVQLELRYQLLFELDPGHRGLLVLGAGVFAQRGL